MRQPEVVGVVERRARALLGRGFDAGQAQQARAVELLTGSGARFTVATRREVIAQGAEHALLVLRFADGLGGPEDLLTEYAVPS